MEQFDYVIIGSGLNSLVAAALLAKAGRRVCVLERADHLGGCILSDDSSVPGFVIDLLSISHLQFFTSPAYAELGADLQAAGLEYCHTPRGVGVMLPDGRSLVLSTDHEDNLKRIAAVSTDDAKAYGALVQAFGANAGLVFGLLGGEPWSFATLKLLYREARQRGVRGLVSAIRELLISTRDSLDTGFRSEEVRALLAPGCLHCGLGPTEALSSLMGQLVTLSLAQAGDPMVKGGSGNLVKAFQKVLAANGAVVRAGTEVTSITISGGRAVGVTTSDGTRYSASSGVIANVTPTQLYERLLTPSDVPEHVARQTSRFRYGRSCMVVHIAMNERPQWVDPEMGGVALMHLTPGLEAVAKAVSEAERGLIPESPTICAVQPVAVDPSRAPEGKWLLWLQILELPKVIKGDARGEIAVPADGRWNDQVAEALADRLVETLSAVMPNLKTSTLYRRVISPETLEAININLVGGDPYSGHCSVDQQLLFRPLPAVKNHETPIRGLYHIGASTHPGPGLGGMSGYLVAKALL